ADSFAAPNSAFGTLPVDLQTKLIPRLQRSSREIVSAPFASLTSFEVHAASEDPGVIASMAALGVKYVVLHNIHDSLAQPGEPRLTAWLDACDTAGIETRCILNARDPEVWRTAVRNYGERIHHFSYLNEPNQPVKDDHTHPHVMPEQYVAELREVRRAVRGIRRDVYLYGPELAMLMVMEEKPFPWLRRALEAGLLDYVDGVSFHPYRQGYSPKNMPEHPSTFEGRPGEGYRTYLEQLAVLRERVRNYPLVINEVGWSTTPKGPISELTQAKFALRQQIMDFAAGIRPAVYFMLRERHVDRPFPAGHLENHFGIVRDDNTPKPAYRALQTLYALLDDGWVPVNAKEHFTQKDVLSFAFEKVEGDVPVRQLLYWLPEPAADDFPLRHTACTLNGVTVSELPLSEAPRALRLHQVQGRWGYPLLVDLLAQKQEATLS
ncbi:MAG TPA: hypothetical protein VHR86_05105, partial [Armatimonadota bacterium]|nr:hypothetical protein [Armatimonadota bacterium]